MKQLTQDLITQASSLELTELEKLSKELVVIYKKKQTDTRRAYALAKKTNAITQDHELLPLLEEMVRKNGKKQKYTN